jgi:GNAT superfamily N-acetyltransferase
MSQCYQCGWGEQGDKEQVQELLDIINPSFAVAEADMWKGTLQRTSKEELFRLIDGRQLLLVREGAVLVGACKISLEERIGDLSMLACHPLYRGKGIGTLMRLFFEDFCAQQGCSHVQVEVLFAKENCSDIKQDTIAWYNRHGYTEHASSHFASLYPHLSPQLAVECSFIIYRKECSPCTNTSFLRRSNPPPPMCGDVCCEEGMG